MIEPESLKAYFDRARLWEQDELRAAIRSKRFAWIVAFIALIGMIASVFAVAALAPLKSVEPFIIRVDGSLGIVDTPTALSDAPNILEMNEAITRYFLAKYVRAHEGYSRATIEHNYDIVSTMSVRNIQASYADWISGNNPDSPQNIYGTLGVVSIRIKAIQLIKPGLASVRYIENASEQESTTTRYWIATIAYELLPEEKLTIQQRIINPLAFAITEYHKDPEVPE